MGDLDWKDWKRDVGLSLRTKLTSFYAYPTAVSIEAAYGLDKFRVKESDFQGEYGREWRFYFTVLFRFDLFISHSL